jgi:sensor domain-cotaining protein
VGTNVSHREYVTQAQKTLEPVFSDGYVGLDGKTRIGISYTIINTQTGRYLGLVVAVFTLYNSSPVMKMFTIYCHDS